MKFIFLVLCIFLGSSGAIAQVEVIKLDWSDRVPQLRWMSGADQKAQNLMTQIRAASMDAQFVKCLGLIPKAKEENPSLRAWLVLQELKCFIGKADNTLAEVQGVLGHVERELAGEPGPWSKELGSVYVGYILNGLRDPGPAVANYLREKLARDTKLLSRLSKGQSASFFEAMGDHAMAERSLEQGLFFYEQSLASEKRASVDQKLIQARKELAKPLSQPDQKELAGASGPARELYSEAKRAKSADEATEKALKYLKTYPVSEDRSEMARLVLSNLKKLSKESERKRLIKQMSEVHYAQAIEWAESLSGGYDYQGAAELQELVLKKAKEVVFDADQWILYGKRRHWSGSYPQAIEAFDEVRKNSPNTPQYFEASYAQGISELRKENFKQAANLFKEVAAEQGELAEPYRMSSLYWAYRSIEQSKDETKELASLRDALNEQFPFTYYSLLLRAEANEGVLNWPVPDAKVEAKERLYLLPHQKASWSRCQLLLKVGWFDEAFSELHEMPEPINSEQRVLLARYLAAAMAYPPAIRLLNKAWDEDPKWRVKDTVRLAYPVEFEKEISESSREHSLSPLLTRSLIRQESGFFVAALSRSNAIGLMQLIPPTAREVLGWMGLLKKTRVPEDVFKPELNVRLGTRYLSHVIRQFDAYVPLALAGYNAGPTRMKKWLGARELTEVLSQKANWQPMDDLWMDELPWGEPRFYVKAILRNALVYQLLEEKDLQVPQPVWRDFYGKTAQKAK